MKPPLGEYYDVNGRKLLLHREGSGGPAVVFLPGAGAVGMDYWDAQRQAAAFTTSVFYDRAGTGWSDGIDLPRSSTEATDELRALLDVAEIPGPYVLAGHSLGGLYARHYAIRFPGEVAGLVLMEPAHEDYRAYMPRELVERWDAWDPADALPDELPGEILEFYRVLFEQEMADWPAGLREPLVDSHVSREWLLTGIREAANVKAVHDEIRAAGPLPDVPMIILTAVAVDPFKRAVSAGASDELLQAETDGKTRLYNDFAASVPRGENRIVEDAGHVTLPFRRPEAAVRAIRDVLAQ
ncbi:alpha/beta hydrolase [Microbispora sp. KK1-11]|uniref:alpha/beta hydrolase n=1 Tax=Microbispora sp. KK1-11 TaxID=2053005 RepID=UPI001159ABA4|nr:alpha/beta hydrolase [Microbispora sp. KK1-11]TQS25896.1 alpha/beta hydrolase [Microbispora sp. KK1-11]